MTRVLLPLLLCAAVAAAADTDPIAKKLDAAKAAYDRDREKALKGVKAWLDGQEDAARKAGDRKRVDQVLADRAALAKGDLPLTAPRAVLAPFDTARKAREASFQQAIRDYTRAKLDGPAGLAEDELRQFRFSLTPVGRAVGGAAARVTSRHSGKVLATADGSKENEAAVIQFDAGDSADRRWVLIPADDDAFQIRNEAGGHLLTVTGPDDKLVSVLKPAIGTGAKAQLWHLIPARTEPGFSLVQHRATGKFLSIDFGSKENGARIIVYKLNGAGGSADQFWKFEKAGKPAE